MTTAVRTPGSFRDASGHVYEADGRVFRTVNEVARVAYESSRDSGILQQLQQDSWIIESAELPRDQWPAAIGKPSYVLEHPRLPFVSYPYEWSFYQLKTAAIHHLKLHRSLLAHGFTLSDASAYNVQFDGPRPVFIDRLSVRPYRDGEVWYGHRQFCEQFLNPILLWAQLGIAPNGWYRGTVEGISTSDLAKIMPLKSRLSWPTVAHVFLHARLNRSAIETPEKALQQAKSARRLSKNAFEAILWQLENWIARMHLKHQAKTVWGDYAGSNTYATDEAQAKRAFVADFVRTLQPRLLFDLGCNTGEYSKVALAAGAQSVVGFDFDHRALDHAFTQSSEQRLAFLPLWLDAANPSPNQGWGQRERLGLRERARADGLIALAFEHHLAIGRNIPLFEVIEWIVGLAPQGLVEFVPKGDETVTRMLALREDVFPEYQKEQFEAHLARRAHIVASHAVSKSGRTVYWYAR
jgi:ribosomal protein L11 methylase PrmA